MSSHCLVFITQIEIVEIIVGDDIDVLHNITTVDNKWRVTILVSECMGHYPSYWARNMTFMTNEEEVAIIVP